MQITGIDGGEKGIDAEPGRHETTPEVREENRASGNDVEHRKDVGEV